MSETIKHMKEWLSGILIWDLDALAQNTVPEKQTKVQMQLTVEAMTILRGEGVFDLKSAEQCLHDAQIWFKLEKLRRTGLIGITDEGIIYKTERAKE